MIKKPLVLTGGEIEQLQPDDRLSPVPNSLYLQNDELTSITLCQPVYITGADTVGYAIATTAPYVIGLAAEDISASAWGVIQTDGKLTATTTVWDAITGGIGGLSPGVTYYLSDSTAGELTSSLPTTQGNYLVRVGIAVNSTDMEIKVSRPIKL